MKNLQKFSASELRHAHCFRCLIELFFYKNNVGIVRADHAPRNKCFQCVYSSSVRTHDLAVSISQINRTKLFIGIGNDLFILIEGSWCNH